MKRITLVSVTAGLAATMGCVAGFGAEVSSQTRAGARMSVGDLGRPAALVIYGNQTYTKGQILAGLRIQIDYHLASHPAAPLDDYIADLEHRITRGYQRAGFPTAQVQATVDLNAHEVVVQVNEGPRYYCGDIVLSGIPTMTNDPVRLKIAQVMAEFEDLSDFQSNAMRGDLRGYVEGVAWRSGDPAPFDESFSDLVTNRVTEALSTLRVYQPKFAVRIVPDSLRKLADVKIEFIDEGVKGTIAEIEVSGLYTNTRPQLLDYLKLKPGMELSATLVAATSNQLWLSARFFRQDVSVVPLPTPGQFKLALDLEEVREAPPLGWEFSVKEKTLLKFCDWLAGWETRAEDFVVSANFTNGPQQGSMELVLSPLGTALAIREASANGPAPLQYAVIASQELIGLYSVGRQSKFTMPRTNTGGHVLLKFRPTSPKSYGRGTVSYLIRMGLPQSQPFRLELELQPAVFLSMAHWMDSSLKDGVLTLTQPSDDGGQVIHIDVASGRLIQASASSGGAELVQIRPGLGAFPQLQREIIAATAQHTNAYVSNRGFSLWVTFLVRDLLKPPRLERVLSAFAVEIESRQSKAMLALAREILNSRNLDAVFAPLDRLGRSKAETRDEKFFVVTVERPQGSLAPSPQATLSAMVLNATEDLGSDNSWLGILIRETSFTVAGQNPYSQSELDKLVNSEDVGPVGCLATAYLVDMINPKLARTFAERGLTRLNFNAFRKDYQMLLRTNALMGELAGNVFGLLNSVDAARLTPILTELGPDEAAFLRQLIQLLADAKAKGQFPAAAIWPAIEQHWEQIPRHYLELGLNRFLPQVRFLTNSQALVDRARLLASPDNVHYDLEEAAQCFRKAADMGHGGAQVSYGHFCEAGKGVPQNFAEAMRWYRKAAEQKATHAMCSIATLYQFAKGVPQDLDEAARWYRLELATVEDCADSQFNLGQICEAKNEMEEAVKRYRLAAEGGWRPAQAKLGDLLSDGLSIKPDDAEACLWLTLAAASGDKISNVLLRRVKTKLTAEQLTDVDARVTAVTQRIEEYERRAERQ